MPSRNREDESAFVVGRLKNQTATGEGSSIPPRVQGEFRVPFVKNLRVVKSEIYAGSTQFTLVWENPDVSTSAISHFNVYVRGMLSGNREPSGPYSVKRSPAIIRVESNIASHVIFVVQTQLTSGLVSDLDRSPSTTGVTTDPITAVTDIGYGTPGALITWDALGAPSTIGPGALDTLVSGRGGGNKPAFVDPVLIGIPRVIAQNIGLNQTVSIGTVTMITDQPVGMYRANIWASVVSPGSAGNLNIYFENFDSLGTLDLSTSTSKSTSLPLYLLASQNIHYYTTVAGASGTPEYSYAITLEQLT
jgi:hypothetical protein